MTSTYAIRFYELMMQYRSTGKREISLEDIRWMFQLQNKYPVWADLKRWVIDQATKEINQYSPYKLTIETKKTGRKITSIVLSFQDKKNLKADKGKQSNKKSKNCDSGDSKQKIIEVPTNFAKQSKNANLNDLEHRVSRITSEIMRNRLSERFKQGSESGMDMIKRIKTEITSEDIAEIWELKLQEMGVVIN
jgi:plasmid replication initiation protein